MTFRRRHRETLSLGLPGGGDQINYLCKIKFFVTRLRISWHRKVIPRSLEDTSQKKRATLLTESAILSSMLELVLNSRHAQIPQGTALEQDLLLLTFKYRIKLFLSSKNGIDFQSLNNHHSPQNKQDSCLKVLERVFLKHWPKRVPFSSLHTDSVLSSIPVYFVPKTFIFLFRCKSPFAETELSCGLVLPFRVMQS